MKEFIKSINIKNAVIIVLITAVIVVGCMYFRVKSGYINLFTRAQELCGEAMIDMELELRGSDSIDPESFYRYDQITSLYEQNYYIKLSERIYPLTDPAISEKLTREEREQLADCIQDAYNSPKDWDGLIATVEGIMSKYIYK